MKKIGIIGAMEEEITPLVKAFSTNRFTATGNNSFYHSLYKGAEIHIAYSKIGKVHAAITASSMILRYGCDVVIFCGVAGGLREDLAVGDLLLGTKLCQHDVDISAFGHPLGFIPESRVFIETDEDLNAIARQVALESNITLKEGIIASGDVFIHNKEKKQWIVDNFGAAAVEMEGASVAVVCDSFKVPYCILRSISDNADGSADVSFDEFLESSAKIGADFVKKMVDRLV